MVHMEGRRYQAVTRFFRVACKTNSIINGASVHREQICAPLGRYEYAACVESVSSAGVHYRPIQT